MRCGQRRALLELTASTPGLARSRRCSAVSLLRADDCQALATSPEARRYDCAIVEF